MTASSILPPKPRPARGSVTGARQLTALSAPGLLWLASLYLVPLGLIVAISFGTSDAVGRPLYGWNPSNYTRVLDPTLLPVLGRTLGFAVICTGISLVLGYVVALAIAQHGGRFKTALLLAVMLPFFVDYLVRILAMVQVFRDGGVFTQVLAPLGLAGEDSLGLLGTPLMVILGLVYNYLPLMILATYVAIEQVDARIVEAGRDLYCSRGQAVWRIVIPMTAPGIAAGCLLVFLATVADFATAQFLGNPGTFMLGNLIYNQFNGAAEVPLGAGLTVVMVLILAVSTLAFSLWSRRHARHST